MTKRSSRERSGFIGSLDFGRDEPICKNWRNAKKAESPPIRSIGLRRVTLRRLAAGHVLYETPGSELGAWTVSVRANIGLGVNRRMAREFGGDAGRMRDHSRQELEQTLGASTSSWKPREKAAFENFAFCPDRCARIADVDTRRKRRPHPNHPGQNEAG